MVSLADLRARNIVPTWQEAVAVVQELLHALAASGSVERLPDSRHIALIANGDVVALPGSPSNEHPVRQLALLLQGLLNGSAAPPQLDQFVAANVTNPPEIATVEEFSMQLAFFERPGRRSDVEALVSRAMSSDAQFRAEEELRRLKTRTAEAHEQTPTPEQVPEPPPPARRERSRQIPLGAAIVLTGVMAAAVAAGGVWWMGGSSPGLLSLFAGEQQTAASDATGAVQESAAPGQAVDGARVGAAKGQRTAGVTGRSPAGSGPSTRPPASARANSGRGSASRTAAVSTSQVGLRAPTATSPRGPRPADGARMTEAANPETSSAAAAALPPSGGAASPQVRAEVTTPAVTGEPPMSVATTTGARTIVYTAADAGVMPAMLLRPLLPAEPPPDVPPSQIGTLELVVDEQGDVERVRLISPSNRYHERMLVAHAKTWKFKPAIRDGRPVKFLTIVRLTI